MNIMKNKYKLIKIVINAYCFELMFISINLYYQQKLMKKGILTEILFLRKKDKKHQKKNLFVNLLELIQVMQKMDLTQIVRLMAQKHLLMSFKIKKVKDVKVKEVKDENKELKDKNIELEEKIEKIEK